MYCAFDAILSALTYNSVNGSFGNYNIGYTVSDGHGGTANANVAAKVLDVNAAPTAVDDGPIDALYNLGLAQNVLLGNETDPEGDILTIVSASNPVGIHTVSVDDYGVRFTFNLDSSISKTDSFTYTVSDGYGHTSTANESVSYAPIVITKSIAFDIDGDGIELVDADGLKKQVDHDTNATNTNGIILAERIGPNGKPEIVGLLSTVAGKLSFAHVISCSALIFFIQPDARNSRTAMMLLKAIEKWTMKRRANEIAIHVTTGREKDARVSVLLDRYGFMNSGGGSYFKRL